MGASLAGDYVTLTNQCFGVLRARLYNYDCVKNALKYSLALDLCGRIVGIV